MTVWDEVGDRLRRLVAARGAAAATVERWEVVRVDPLMVESSDGDVLEEGDDDVEIDRELLDDRPEKGDVVRVHADGDGWILSGVIR